MRTGSDSGRPVGGDATVRRVDGDNERPFLVDHPRVSKRQCDLAEKQKSLSRSNLIGFRPAAGAFPRVLDDYFRLASLP